MHLKLNTLRNFVQRNTGHNDMTNEELGIVIILILQF